MTADEALAHAKVSFRRGSKSFAAASLLFDAATRRDATLLYAWCRHCDDVIDGQVLGHGQVQDATPAAERLASLQVQTDRAYAGDPGEDPAFVGLHHVASRHAIPAGLARAHLDGFRMDVEGRCYHTIEDTIDYCYHVAGVVGLMMAHVMGVRDPSTLRRACDLGIAFQLTNIARDMTDDAANGRLYVPLEWLEQAGIVPGALGGGSAATARAQLAARLLELADTYYASARIGIAGLKLRSAWAIATAHGIYRHIGVEIRSRGDDAWAERVRTTRLRKTALVLHGGIAALGRRRAVAKLPPVHPVWYPG